MSFQFGYLTPKQRKFWGLRRRGLTEAQIFREMAVTRQTMNKTFNVIDSKVSRALLEAAEINRVEVRRVNSEGGFLLGFSPMFGMEVLVTFSERNGIQVWYRGEGGCSQCSWLRSCRQKLLTEADERGIPLPKNVEALEPSKLSEILFKRITEE